MFATAPTIATCLDAIDELDDVRRSLEGLSQIVLALEVADLAEKESLDLVARLLDYFSLDTAIIRIETAENSPSLLK